jgi:hypothetical protein
MHANIINTQRLYANGEDPESGALKKLLQRLFCPEGKVMRRRVYDRVKQGRPAPEPRYGEAKLSSLLQDLVQGTKYLKRVSCVLQDLKHRHNIVRGVGKSASQVLYRVLVN